MFRISLRIRAASAISAGAVLALATWVSSPLSAQGGSSSAEADRTHIEDVLRGLNRGRGVGQVAISPDGKKLAWVEGGRGGGQIMVAPPEDVSKPERVIVSKGDDRCSANGFTWEPDSKALAFLSICSDSNGEEQIYLSHLDGNPAKRLTALKGYVHEPAFSPDGSSIAFLYVAGATRPAGALAAMKPPAGVIGEDNVEVQRVAMVRADALYPDAGRPTESSAGAGGGERTAARAADCGAALVAGQRIHSLHRRTDERSGIDRRGCMAGPCGGRNPERSHQGEADLARVG